MYTDRQKRLFQIIHKEYIENDYHNIMENIIITDNLFIQFFDVIKNIIDNESIFNSRKMNEKDIKATLKLEEIKILVTNYLESKAYQNIITILTDFAQYILSYINTQNYNNIPVNVCVVRNCAIYVDRIFEKIYYKKNFETIGFTSTNLEESSEFTEIMNTLCNFRLQIRKNFNDLNKIKEICNDHDPLVEELINKFKK